MPTLESVHSQTYRPIDLVIVDDGSTDDTLEHLNRWSKQFASSDFSVIVSSQTNLGAPSARNNGVDISSGELVQFLDSDDVLHPQKLEKQVAKFEENSIELVWSDETLFRQSPDWREGKALLLYPESQLLNRHLSGMGFLIQNPLFRRSLLQSAGPWDPEQLIGEVWMHYAKVLLHLKQRRKVAAFQPGILSAVRQHTGPRMSDGLENGDRAPKLVRSVLEVENLARSMFNEDEEVLLPLAKKWRDYCWQSFTCNDFPSAILARNGASRCGNPVSLKMSLAIFVKRFFKNLRVSRTWGR